MNYYLNVDNNVIMNFKKILKNSLLKNIIGRQISVKNFLKIKNF